MRKIETDELQQELLTHEDITFPVILFIDDYDEFFDQTMNIHWHPDVVYTLVLSGELDYYINGVPHRIKEGDCVFVNSNTLYMAKKADPFRKTRTFIAMFPPSFLSKDIFGNFYQKYFQPIAGKTLEGFIVSRHNPAGLEIRDLLRQLQLLDPKEFGFELSCLGLLYRLWKYTIDYIREEHSDIFFDQKQHKSSEIAKAMLLHIHTHYQDHLSIESIAQAISVSKSECFRCFKMYTHQTPIEYINNYRLSQAERMLIDTNSSITEISYACGFLSSSYFTKLFKEKHSVTPRQYRENFV